MNKRGGVEVDVCGFLALILVIVGFALIQRPVKERARGWAIV